MSDSEPSDHLERRIDRHEHRLLKREHLIRRNYHSALGMLLLSVLGIIGILWIHFNVPLNAEEFDGPAFGITFISSIVWMAILGGVMFSCRAKLRHIESIKHPPHLRERRRCPLCDYNLKDLTTDGCSECGWRRK